MCTSRRERTNLVLIGVHLALAVRKLHRLVAIRLHSDDGAVGKEVLLDAVSEDVLDGLIWKRDLLRSIRVVLLGLLTEQSTTIRSLSDGPDLCSQVHAVLQLKYSHLMTWETR